MIIKDNDEVKIKFPKSDLYGHFELDKEGNRFNFSILVEDDIDDETFSRELKFELTPSNTDFMTRLLHKNKIVLKQSYEPVKVYHGFRTYTAYFLDVSDNSFTIILENTDKTRMVVRILKSFEDNPKVVNE